MNSSSNWDQRATGDGTIQELTAQEHRTSETTGLGGRRTQGKHTSSERGLQLDQDKMGNQVEDGYAALNVHLERGHGPTWQGPTIEHGLGM